MTGEPLRVLVPSVFAAELMQALAAQPFALLPDAMCHGASNMCAIMPKHIAETDPFKAFTEVIGSGPFRFKWDERV